MMKAVAILLAFFLTSAACEAPSIIIIGAGPSGIAAATKLLENGIYNLKILEAENRIGGRINSIKIGDAYVDLGAQWCHGEGGNLVYQIVKDMNVLEHSQTPELLLHSSVASVNQDFGKELTDLMYKIYDDANDKYRNTTIGDFCIEKFNKEIQTKYGDDEQKLKMAKDSIDYFEHTVISSEGAFSWFDPICSNDYIDATGDHGLNWKDKGYKLLLDILMKKYPDPSKQLPIDDKIFLNKEVVNITWNIDKLEKGVIVKCEDQSEYVADHVIFTPSVGVLKASADEMFVPNLPQRKTEAIESIGFGAVMKLILQFPNKWWNNTGGIIFIWSDDDMKTASKEFTEGPKLEGRSWITHLFALAINDYSPNVITAWLAGPLVPETEKLPLETLKKGVYYVLKKFIGHDLEFGEIEKIIPSKWYTNPHFRGTYSYQTFNTTLKSSGKSSEEDLAEPILNKEGKVLIQFAGEATNPIHYSTVHGAVETGYREANRLIDLYKKM